jgi:DHA1 family bicyclomycin/chloramphenicol resistance-like MFS transporter
MLTTLISVVLGGLVGSFFDGTTLPMTLGFILFGCLSFFTIFWAENWQLFRRPGRAHLRQGF